MPPSSPDSAATLQACYAAAIRAVRPEAAMRAPLADVVPDATAAWIVAVGKASGGMAAALVAWMASHGRQPGGGIVIAAEPVVPAHASLRCVVGDHPIPGAASARAAGAIAEVLAGIPPAATLHVAISGGASALMAGPLAPLTDDDLVDTFRRLFSSGLDIQQMNAVRKRLTRWSAGRLALAAAPRCLHVWVISDVAGDDLSTIGSGPCTGDDWTSAAVVAMLDDRGQLAGLPDRVRAALRIETPKPDDPWLATIVPRIVANNAMALEAAAVTARSRGIDAKVAPGPLHGDAATMGRAIAAALRQRQPRPVMTIWGGETTVAIADTAGRGGRSQELALAAAEVLRGADVALLAAGTDGRDGPTDAAGAVVDGTTWSRIVASDHDPAAALAQHDSYPALDAIGALLRTGPTGTNVMDVAFGLSSSG